MNLFNRTILPFLLAITFFGLFLAGCLDAPNDPEDLQPVDAVSIMIKQHDSDYSSTLKVNPSDSATIRVSVVPKKFENDLTYEWYYENEGKKKKLKRGKQYSFHPQSNDLIPNKLIITDNDNNKNSFDFTVIVNTPPVLSDSTIPADGDTLYGSKKSAFLFEWFSNDMDLSNGDSLFHILEIDGIRYDVGTLLQVKQSGFKAGKHKFRIVVQDLYGDTDSLAYRHFYVVDTLEAK